MVAPEPEPLTCVDIERTKTGAGSALILRLRQNRAPHTTQTTHKPGYGGPGPPWGARPVPPALSRPAAPEGGPVAWGLVRQERRDQPPRKEER